MIICQVVEEYRNLPDTTERVGGSWDYYHVGTDLSTNFFYIFFICNSIYFASYRMAKIPQIYKRKN